MKTKYPTNLIDSHYTAILRIIGDKRKRGVDVGKKIKGRERHIITDTQGLLL